MTLFATMRDGGGMRGLDRADEPGVGRGAARQGIVIDGQALRRLEELHQPEAVGRLIAGQDGSGRAVGDVGDVAREDIGAEFHEETGGVQSVLSVL